MHQPSRFMVILVPLDREARNWLHTMQWDGYPVPNHMTPSVAEEVLGHFEKEGGQLVPN